MIYLKVYCEEFIDSPSFCSCLNNRFIWEITPLRQLSSCGATFSCNVLHFARGFYIQIRSLSSAISSLYFWSLCLYPFFLPLKCLRVFQMSSHYRSINLIQLSPLGCLQDILVSIWSWMLFLFLASFLCICLIFIFRYSITIIKALYADGVVGVPWTFIWTSLRAFGCCSILMWYRLTPKRPSILTCFVWGFFYLHGRPTFFHTASNFYLLVISLETISLWNFSFSLRGWCSISYWCVSCLLIACSW